MDKIIAFIKTKPGKIFLVLFIGLLLIIGGLTVFFITRNNTSENTTITVESEEEPGLTLIGFQVFYDFGFSAEQQQTIYSTVFQYISDFNPNIQLVEYISGSFSYSPEDSSRSSFELTSDLGTNFIVNLDTLYSYTDIQIQISPL